MKIYADENIPLVKEAFGHLGDVLTFKGRDVQPEDLARADILLVRSVTRVDASLIAGSSLKFVGTATIGTDHIDLRALSESEIEFSSAPGSNANSVGEYVMAALLNLGSRYGIDWSGKTLGIIGVGNCGSRVEALAPALELELLYCDPPLKRETGNPRYRPLEEVVEADILTFHVPLTKDGRDPTYHLIDEALLERRPENSVLINASRGAVADSRALLQHFEKRKDQHLVLDVWEGEPRICLDLLELTALASPHIAGYSYDGKVKGMLMLYESVCRFLGVEASSSVVPYLAQDKVLDLKFQESALRTLNALVSKCYDIQTDDENMRRLIGLPPSDRAIYFDSLRKGYRVRREFTAFKVQSTGADQEFLDRVRCLGFQVAG